ncbi:hypothetical protein AS850_09710 [Frondihabitans sp. 762G35]|uniref:hypothetical protein n=1 Tax=Frondihabitans sp. 762G35 TaxID=1446794 RepID=UPI000D206868|nr:hypothetical protein [Frondihabitans sp. 762G35]ARC57350.1 hypothetical protein AS850_09710 [Frondihabitans sp. 762G35]
MSVGAGRDDAGLETRPENDDEALSWGESRDPSYVEGPAADAASTAVGDDPDDDPEEDDEELPEGVLSSPLLVAHGVFGAVFLLYTVAWLLAVSRGSAPNLAGVPLAFWYIGQYLAVVSAPLWFTAALLLTPVTPPKARLIWFVAGVVVLLPWPFLLGVSL